MPGFDLKVNGEYARLDSLLCPSCRFILKDAIQTEEGIRFCKSCCEEIQNSPSNTCPVSGTRIGKNEEIHPDIAVRREVERLPVKCMNSEEGCPWTGKLKDHETTHKLECLYVTDPCPMGCGKKLSKNDIQAHLDTKCPLRKVNCQFCRETFTARDYDEHIDVCTKAPSRCRYCNNDLSRSEMTRHSLLECGVARTCVGCNQKIDVNPTGRNPTIATHLKEPGVVFEHLQALGNEVKSCGLKVASNSSQLRQLANVKDSDNRSKEKSLDDILIRLANVEAATTENKQAIATRGAGVGNQGGLYGSGISSYGSNQYDSDASDRLAQLENKLAEQERTAGMLKVHISELELQLQASLASTYNGSFLWRIPDVKRRRRDAIDGKITSIYSPPFYTGRNGYKMCIRAYLNGDGIGYNTHVSIFFVLMKGEYDPLLKWPFDYKVSLILVDQDHRRHIVQTFKPSPSSSSFQRPKSDMNIASGCPKFSELKVLDNESYVKEDVMYIKAIVDTTRIFHP